ncbi:archaeosine biosynthesis radical SAM protein RaSEA [Haloquadratum walsbyi]|jgi:conserved hypothetical protein TIGR01210|uniref:TIGR01210 family protein n=1 Tax=Haloquadratum walsbyi J07HQW2 TaxID=1238425 RepID=U1MY68_9EURY|nr:archaeosine biosynthesis radical SAM protein RaSEA [Haloquadratum walsbyi]ERG95424.1 MAG: TIGR01210 family protein [Haloquadratum walsbyi J07HQW2]
MSDPPPNSEVSEQDRGVDTHNQMMRETRREKHDQYSLHEPIEVCIDKDNTPDGVVSSLSIILNTGGCRLARADGCTICGPVADSVDDDGVSHDALMNQIDFCIKYEQTVTNEPAELVKLHTPGSFLDEREVSVKSRQAIAETFADRNRIIVESLPEFVNTNTLRPFTAASLTTDIAIGVETATDRIRHDCLNKQLNFTDFQDACGEVCCIDAMTSENIDIGIKACLLLKPPFLSESEAIGDMVESVRRCAHIDGCHTVSINPAYVQQHTMTDELFHRGGYRPPWLWSITEVLESTRNVDAIVVSDLIEDDSDRGPHNCGECDERVQIAIEDFNRRQEPSVFTQVECECEATWAYILDAESSYAQPLTQ